MDRTLKLCVISLIENYIKDLKYWVTEYADHEEINYVLPGTPSFQDMNHAELYLSTCENILEQLKELDSGYLNQKRLQALHKLSRANSTGSNTESG